MMGRVFLALAIFLLSGSYALADGFYAGSDVTVTNIEVSVPGPNFRNRPIGLRLHAGYEFSELFALEGSYTDSGEAEDQGLKLESSAYVMSFVLQNNRTTPNLFTKLGYYNGNVKGSVPGNTFDDNVEGVAAGLGFRHEILSNRVMPFDLAIRGEVDYMDSDLDNLWSVGIGLQFSFGGSTD